jgi:hypothetical protein
MGTVFSPESWPWVTLIVGVVGFALGMMFGRPRVLAGWGGGRQVCGAACTCRGANCPEPVGDGHPHQHCHRRDDELSCSGTCTLAPHAATTPHSCSHRGHTF